ncbi:MAG: hypothetical protein IH586_11015, partial [Anaerolineaceae bacterium]|nr:hypothetical protein [Anaerolineaceae bacterium]
MRASAIFVPVLFLLLCVIIFLPRSLHTQAANSEILPYTSLLKQPALASSPIAPSVSVQPVFSGLGEFATTVLNNSPDEVVGIFVEDLFALPVAQQPKDQPAFVSSEDNLVTQFSMPNQYGVIGLLAHNYLSGKLFFDLRPGDEVVVIYGDGHSELYHITHSEQFQALNPLSPFSEFIDITNPSNKKLSSAALFNHIYTTPNNLVFQTCIDANGDPS